MNKNEKAKKAEVQWTTLTWIIAAVILVSLVAVFSPLMKKALASYEWDWAFFQQRTTATIDEERIDKDTSIEIETLPTEIDKESGGTVIIKQEYGNGWNLEVQKTLFDTVSERYTGPGWLLVYLMSGEEQPKPILENKKLAEIFADDHLKGAITVNGKQYVHTNAENDFQWFEDVDKDSKYTAGKDKDMKTEDLTQLKLAELWEEAAG